MVVKMLTELAVKNAKPSSNGKEYWLSDGRNLFMRIQPSGAKSWVYRYRKGNATVKLTMAPYSSEFGLKEARKRAREYEAIRCEYPDLKGKLQTDSAARALSARSQLPVREVASEWFERIVKVRKRPEYVRAMLDNDILPAIGHVPIGKVHRSAIADLCAAVVERGARVQANRVLLAVKQLFGYAVDNGYRDEDPTHRLRRKTTGGVEKPRERNLSFEELAQFCHVLWSPEFFASPSVAGVLRLIVLTGQRIGETVRMKWEDVDLNSGEWNIPAENTKNGKRHLVHLSLQARQVLLELKPKYLLQGEAATGWVFQGIDSSREGNSVHVTERAVNKVVKRLLADPEALPSTKARTAKPNAIKKQRISSRASLYGMQDFSVHDLRRTMVSRLADMEEPPHVVEKMVNHVMTGVMAVYNRGQYIEARRKAFERWGAKIAALRGDTVVRLSVGRTAHG